jgi:chromosome segregation ATPase
MRNIFFIIALIAIAQIAFAAKLSQDEIKEADKYTSFDTQYDLSTGATSYNPLQDPIYKLRFLKQSLKKYEKEIDDLKVKPGNEEQIADLKAHCKSIKADIQETTEQCIAIAKSACKQVKATIDDSKNKDRKRMLQAHLTHLETLIDTLKGKKITPMQRTTDIRYANYALRVLLKQLNKKVKKTEDAIQQNVKELKNLH